MKHGAHKSLLMILSLVIIYSLSNCSPSIHKLNNKAKSTSPNWKDLKCIIEPRGIYSIVVDSSLFVDVINVLGKGKIQFKWQFDGFFPLGYFEIRLPYKKFFIRYPDIGLTFWGFKYKGKIKVRGIHLNNHCQCKTPEGIGIGSHHDSLFNIYKEQEYYYLHQGGKDDNAFTINNFVFGLNTRNNSKANVIYIDIQ